MEGDPLPPRSSYRPTAQSTQQRRSPSVSSSASAESYSRPSRPWLLERRVLSVEQYADEVRRGAAAKEELASAYGGRTAPIPVPLDEGESEAAYERRFIRWLCDDRRLPLKKVQEGGANNERNFRMQFAKLQVAAQVAHNQSSLKRRRTDEFDDASTSSRDAKRPQDEAGPEASRRLLRKRVISFTEYKEEMERLGGQQQTAEERKALYGTLTAPIPVPLYGGETFREYEEKFQNHLKTVSMDLSRLPHEPNTERCLRLAFARKRFGDSKRSSKHEVETIRSEAAVEETDPVFFGDQQELSDASTADTVQKPKVSSHREPGTQYEFPPSCSLLRPSAGESTGPEMSALLSCGCRQCLLQCTGQLIARVSTLEETLGSRSTGVSGEKELKDLMDLTKDADSSASLEPSRPTGVDVGRMLHITSLVRQRRQQREHSQSTVPLIVEDPIEQQLLSQYNEINDRVIVSQQTLEDSAAQLQLQQENSDLPGLIEEKMSHRNAALAMLLVYMWRHNPEELEQRIQAPSAANIPHVQRMCHHKCATTTSVIAKKKEEACELTVQLETVLNEPAPTTFDPESDRQRLDRLQELGTELTRVESDIRTLVASRRREFTTLLHFDAHIRQLAAAFLKET